MAKLPWPDPAKIVSVGLEVAVTDRDLWRLHQPAGDFPLRWDELRTFGPLTSARFDPWLPPPADRTGDSVATGAGYFGFDVPTCLAEVFQATRRVDLEDSETQLTAFKPTRQLHLIDFRGGWPILVGAAHQLNSGPKDRCRAWAHAIREIHPGYDGVIYTGMAGRNCAVVYAPPGDVFPLTPAFTKALADPSLDSYISDAAKQIGYDVKRPA